MSMHMAPRAAAWVAWVVWTCNTPEGYSVKKRAGFSPLFFLSVLQRTAHTRAEESTGFVGSRLEDQIVLTFPIGKLLFDLAAHRILSLIRNPAVRLRLRGLDDLLDELLPARVRLVEAVQPDDAGGNRMRDAHTGNVVNIDIVFALGEDAVLIVHLGQSLV